MELISLHSRGSLWITAAEVVVFTLYVGVCLFQTFVSKTENNNNNVFIKKHPIFKNQSIKKAIFETFSVNAGPDNGFPTKVYNTVFVPWEQAIYWMVIEFEVIKKASVAFLQKFIYVVINRRITPLIASF